jgi:hypothetical protein
MLIVRLASYFEPLRFFLPAGLCPGVARRRTGRSLT